MTGLRFGYSGAATDGVDELVDLAIRAERAGFDTFALAAAEHADTFILAGVPPAPKLTLPPGQLVLPERDATARLLERLRRHAGTRPLEIGTGAAVVLTDDAGASAAELATIHTYLTAEQILKSPKILIGTAPQITDRLIDRSASLGITYHVLRGAPPEQLTAVIARARPGT